VKTLGFINTNKIKKIVFIILATGVICFVGCVKSDPSHDILLQEGIRLEELIDHTQWYSIYKIGQDSYMYEIYNNDEEVIWRDCTYRIEPRITLYESRYIEVWVGVGTGTWYVTYYDLQTSFITENLEGARYLKNGKVAQVIENESRKLRIFSPFAYDSFLEEVELKLYEECANPADCLLNVGIVDEDQVQIYYLNSLGEVDYYIYDLQNSKI